MIKKCVLEIINKYKNEKTFNLDHVISDIVYNIKKDRLSSEDFELLSKSDYAIIYYRVSEYFYYKLKETQVAYLIADEGLTKTKIYISPKVVIGEGFSLKLAQNTKILEDVRIGENFEIFGKATINSAIGENSLLSIGNNVCLKDRVCVRGNIRIGNNICVREGCTVLEDIGDNCEVKVATSLQILSAHGKNLLPSQKLFVYGVVPKFKNQIVIYGEGFYNPIIDIKCKNYKKQIESEITYWDKNTIIVKIKPTFIDLEWAKQNKIIIKSNGYKCVVNNCGGLLKILG